jgi:hypothetical protein
MEEELADFNEDPYKGLQIWTCPRFRSFSNGQGEEVSRPRPLGASPLPNENLETLKKLVKNCASEFAILDKSINESSRQRRELEEVLGVMDDLKCFLSLGGGATSKGLGSRGHAIQGNLRQGCDPIRASLCR